MQYPVSITAISTISALGISTEAVWNSYLLSQPCFENRNIGDQQVIVSCLDAEAEEMVAKLRSGNSNYRRLDRTVLLALAATIGLKSTLKNTSKAGINIGSSRGATGLFEQYYDQFQKENSVSAYTSPTTTLGNISSWVAQELGVSGIAMGHSVTCSTALHAVLNGIAWLNSNMCDQFVAGGSEAALTPFTLAQMQALMLYSRSENTMACESMRFQKKQNTMILGEGAGLAVLEKGVSTAAISVIDGVGYANEPLEHGSSISANGLCFQRSMRMALDHAGTDTVDVVIMHAPGTVKGDLAEKKAIDAVFGNKLPLLTSNKWLVGHTFGASGMMSLEMGVLMLHNNRFIENPFYENARHLPKQLKSIMVNAVGFGGNAVSIIISKPNS